MSQHPGPGRPAPTPPPGPAPGPARKPPTLMQNLGAFFGHIIKGAKTPVHDPNQPQEVSREVREQTATTPDGHVTYRETVIREVVVKPAPPGATPVEPPRPG